MNNTKKPNSTSDASKKDAKTTSNKKQDDKNDNKDTKSGVSRHPTKEPNEEG